MNNFKYPEVRRDENFSENYHGTMVKDPYRWLEDLKSEETKKFIEDQDAVTNAYLDQCPVREKITSQLVANLNYAKVGDIMKRGAGKYYQFDMAGAKQGIMTERSTLDKQKRIVLDPNAFDTKDKASILSMAFVSPNGKWLAYACVEDSADWVTVRVRNLESLEDLPDKLVKVKYSFSLEWTEDSKGFLYNQFPHVNCALDGVSSPLMVNQKVYYHLINTDQSEDVLKYELPEEPNVYFQYKISHDFKYIFLFLQDCLNCKVLYCKLDGYDMSSKELLKPKPIFTDNSDYKFEYGGNIGDMAFFRTDAEAPNFKFIKVDLKNPSKENWVDIVEEREDELVDSGELFTVDEHQYLLVRFLKNVAYYQEIHELMPDGSLKFVRKLGELSGNITKYLGKQFDGEIFYSCSSFLSPCQSYHFDLRKMDSEPRLLSDSVPDGFTPSDFTVKQVMYPSKDGVKVPMYIVHHKNLVLDGSNPCLLFAYGGFGEQMGSRFDVNRLVWLKNLRGIFCVASIRGGGELGTEWHNAARMHKKQKTFDDMIAAGEYLIREKYTNPTRLAIEGGSNGGLVVSACSVQRPELFGAVIDNAGVMDCVRMQFFTIGTIMFSEFGDVNVKADFEAIYKYSPYHNVPDDPSRFPASLVLTSVLDDRVVAMHSLKFVAELQHKLAKKFPDVPLMLLSETISRHSMVRHPTYVAREFADIYTFLYNALSLKYYD